MTTQPNDGFEELDFTPPELPYAGTSGFSGSDTSEARARREDGEGTTSKRQKEAIDFLEIVKYHGATWKELADFLHVHHGSASNVLSIFHLKGYAMRLQESRNRCKVYVLPQYVQDRKTEIRKVKKCPHCHKEL
jgi:hypothetical protein